MLTLELISDIKQIQPLLWFTPNIKHIWVKISEDDQAIGILELQPITNVIANIHLHLFKKYQKNGIANQLEAPLVEIAQQVGLTTLLAIVPEFNDKINKVLLRSNFQFSAILPNGVIYQNKLQNAVVYIRSVLLK